MDAVQFDAVIEAGRDLQERLNEILPVVVGGTAAALHCKHRYSLDVDVVPYLSSRFVEIKTARWEGWRTNR